MFLLFDQLLKGGYKEWSKWSEWDDEISYWNVKKIISIYTYKGIINKTVGSGLSMTHIW